MVTHDTLRDYYRRIGRIRLLDGDEVVDAARRHQAGLEAARRLAAGVDDESARTVLTGLVADGERCRQRLVEHNLRLVPKIAARYRGQGVDQAALIQYGNIGLMRAVDKFDPSRGYRFATYAVWWIRQSVQRGVHSDGRTIRVPNSAQELAYRSRIEADRLRLELGRDADERELADALEVDVERLREVRQAMQHLTSLDRVVSDDGQGATLGELLVDEAAASPQDEAVAAAMGGQLQLVLARLPERERLVLTRTFGLDGDDAWTDEQMAAYLGVSRSAAYQIRKRACERLRHPANRNRLAQLAS